MNDINHLEEESRAYYNQRFGKNIEHPGIINADEQYRWQVIEKGIRGILPHLAQNTPLQLLDFGCGRGWLSQKLSVFGHVTAVDLSPEPLEKAARFFPQVTFKVLNASLPAGDQLPVNFFDMIVSSEVIEHIVNQQEYMNNIIKLLKPGGILILTTPNAKWYDYHFNRNRQSWKQPVEHWLSDRELTALLQNQLTVLQLNSFHAHWIFDYRTHGIPGLIGHPLFRKFLKLTGIKEPFQRWLEKKGYGLYHFLCAVKK